MVCKCETKLVLTFLNSNLILIKAKDLKGKVSLAENQSNLFRTFYKMQRISQTKSFQGNSSQIQRKKFFFHREILC
jgi:hypothetical protein